MGRLVWILLVLLTACGGDIAAPMAAPSFNADATATRGAEQTEVAVVTGATATPTTRTLRAPLQQGASVTIPGAYRITILNERQVDYVGPDIGRAVTFHIENLATADLQYNQCSFILRDGTGQDHNSRYCNSVRAGQGPTSIAAGGFRDEPIELPYPSGNRVMWVRFIPLVPSGTTVFFDET